MRSLLFFLSLIFLGAATHAKPSSTSRIAAVVNSAVITKADLMNRLKFAAISSGLEPTPQNLDKIKDQMLRVMIDEQIQLEIGERYQIDIPEEHVQTTIKEIESSNGMPSGHINKLLKANKIPEETFKKHIKAQLIWVFYIRQKYPLKSLEDSIQKKHEHDISPSLQIADWEVEREIQRQKEKDTQTQYHLAEIFLNVDNKSQEESVKRNIAELFQEVRRGANFQVIAQQFSQSPTASVGGDMGWLTEDQVEPEIRELLTQLQPGQLSPPIRTSQGYTIIAYIERQLPKADGSVSLTVQQVLFPFPQNAAEWMAREIMNQAGDVAKKAKSCSTLEKLAKQTSPSAQAHMIRNEPMENLTGELLSLIQSLDLNKASEPLLTPEGAVVVMVCDKNVQKTKELSRNEIVDLIASQKYSLIAKRELRDLRRNAFIDIRM